MKIFLSVLLILLIPLIGVSQKEIGGNSNQFYYVNPEMYPDGSYVVVRAISANDAIVAPKPGFESIFESKIPVNNNWKFAPSIDIQRENQQVNRYLVQVTDSTSFRNFAVENDIEIHNYDSRVKSFVIRSDWKKVHNEIVNLNYVTFIDVHNRAMEEANIRSHDLGINGIEYVHSNNSELDGKGIVISIKERNLFSDDLDIIGRIIESGKEDEETSLHATEMATLIAGAGNSFKTGRGVARAAELTSVSFSSLQPETESYYSDNNISIQNHSYGVEINNYYGIESQGFDQLHNSIPTLTTIFSAGNSGNATAISGTYTEIEGYANITGSFKQAKNNIIVAAIDTSITRSILSSRGPAYDGRVKPDISAFGGEGTSEAAALVSGSVALLQNYYNSKIGNLPSSSLIKSLLVAGADDLKSSGVSWEYGFGNLNLINSIYILQNEQYFESDISSSSENDHIINIPTNVSELRIALSWIDPPANPGDYKALVNDLDLSLINTSTLEEWNTWILNPYAHQDSLTKSATRGIDSLNNLELITLSVPDPGNYRIQISSTDLKEDNQQYRVAYFYKLRESFRWISPVSKSNVEAGENDYLRWNSTYGNVSGDLDITYGDGTWQSIKKGIPLDKPYQKLLFKDTTSLVNLRMKVGDYEYVTDTFTISPLIRLEVGFNCENDALLQWSLNQNTSGYTLKGLEEKYLTDVITTNDTLHLLEKSGEDKLYFTIEPLIGDGKSGLRSSAINYQEQAIGCYVKNFYGSVNDAGFGDIMLELSSNYNVTDILLEKISPEQILTSHSISQGSELSYSYIDEEMEDGISYYQSVIEIDNGSEVRSDSIALVYLDEKQALVFPNPLAKGEGLNVLTDILDPVFQLLDTQGKPVYETQFSGNGDYIILDHLSSGLYIYRILNVDQVIDKGRILVLDVTK